MNFILVCCFPLKAESSEAKGICLYPVHVVVGVALAPPLAGVAAVAAVFAILRREQHRH